jgi:hypothetical protein
VPRRLYAIKRQAAVTATDVTIVRRRIVTFAEVSKNHW